MRLICIRHLPTLWNKQALLQGRGDIEILPPDKSCQQAIHQNLLQLKAYGAFDLISVSSLKRTQQTAIMYGYNIQDVVIEPLLDELDFGIYEGKPKTSLLKAVGQKWLNNPKELVLGNITPVADMELRIKRFLAKYSSRYNQIVVFGHGGWIRGLLSITKYGNIQAMNQMVVENNQLIVIS